MNPAKFLGLGFLAAAWWLRREARQQPGITLAAAARIVGAAICLVAAILCLTGPRGEF